jgi:DNA-binding GntR family transcriptional regulator
MRSPEEILEIYGVRVVLEGLVARTAAVSRSELDLANLASRHSQMLEVKQDDFDLMATSNRQFHEALWYSSHNRVLIDILVRLNSHLSRYPMTTLSSPGRWKTVLDDHQRLIDAITARDAALAGSIAEAHMAAAREIRLHLYASERPQVYS